MVGHRDRTVLMLGAEKGDPAIIRMLLDHGAFVNASDRDGWTALLLAVSGGHRGAVEALLAAGAEVNVWLSRVTIGGTPLSIARSCLAGSRHQLRFLDGEISKRATAERRSERTGRPSSICSSKPEPENRPEIPSAR
jgi:ankyrin repeat protein